MVFMCVGKYARGGAWAPEDAPASLLSPALVPKLGYL